MYGFWAGVVNKPGQQSDRRLTGQYKQLETLKYVYGSQVTSDKMVI